MTDQEKGKIIRCIATCVLVCEYKLLQLKDQTKQDLKSRVNVALAACKRVQDWFVHHPNASSNSRQAIKEEMLSNEIVMLSELFEVCFGLTEDSLEELIREVKRNIYDAALVNKENTSKYG